MKIMDQETTNSWQITKKRGESGDSICGIHNESIERLFFQCTYTTWIDHTGIYESIEGNHTNGSNKKLRGVSYGDWQNEEAIKDSERYLEKRNARKKRSLTCPKENYDSKGTWSSGIKYQTISFILQMSPSLIIFNL